VPDIRATLIQAQIQPQARQLLATPVEKPAPRTDELPELLHGRFARTAFSVTASFTVVDP
jgi:hypothetical protein